MRDGELQSCEQRRDVEYERARPKRAGLLGCSKQDRLDGQHRQRYCCVLAAVALVKVDGGLNVMLVVMTG